MRAAELARSNGWDIQKIYWNTIPVSVIEEGIAAMKGTGVDFFGVEKAEDFPFAAPDELVTTVFNGDEFVEKKMAAMKAHPTQIAVDGPFFALSDNLGFRVWGREFYRLVKGEAAAPFDEKGRELDLFAGVELN
jgi:N-acetyl-1-D-myo-inositol-2-amino-2-deoxy-alpha-D-glucopyranoside deacetylase